MKKRFSMSVVCAAAISLCAVTVMRAQDAGVAHVALHGRTAAQGYSGAADWDAIAHLVAALDIPVLGNGDIWGADDALRMVDHTGCAGVVVGRGCLGRPWLFTELAAAFTGTPAPAPPTLGQVLDALRSHAVLEVADRGDPSGVVHMRKHMAWYLQGFAVGSVVRTRLGLVSSMTQLDDLLAGLDRAQTVPLEQLGVSRGRTSKPPRVVLPHGWLDDRDSGATLDGAEDATSGG